MDSNQPDEELDVDMEEVASPVTRERAERFYDRMRTAIRRYLDKKGAVAGKTGEYLLLAPDIFVLLWRLVNDPRVTSKNKVMLGSGVAYFLFPLDIIPDIVAIGYIDDLIFGAFLLNKIMTDTDVEVLREHWSGSEDILATIQKILAAADSLTSSDILGKIKKGVK
jgi:uncharacterized membrane protein YkvA (DUF1232 family)